MQHRGKRGEGGEREWRYCRPLAMSRAQRTSVVQSLRCPVSSLTATGSLLSSRVPAYTGPQLPVAIILLNRMLLYSISRCGGSDARGSCTECATSFVSRVPAYTGPQRAEAIAFCRIVCCRTLSQGATEVAHLLPAGRTSCCF